MSKKLYREYDNEGNLIKKECGECREIKTVDNFHKSKRDGYVTRCKSCEKQYREKNKDKIKEYKKQYHENNKDKISEYNRQYRESNKDKLKEQGRQYRENNKDKIKECNHQYYENNKDKIKEQVKQYRENNKDEIKELKKQYYENNKDKFKEYHRQQYESDKDKNLERCHQWYEVKCKQEIERIYKNVTKERYPRNGIQYGIIYGVHCIPTDKWYIGQTVRSFNIRYQGDFFNKKSNELSEDNIKGKLLAEDIEKYGQESFEIFEVIDVAFSEKELDEKEAYYIDQYKAYDEGYNSNRGNIFKHNKLKRREENDYQREGISRIC